MKHLLLLLLIAFNAAHTSDAAEMKSSTQDCIEKVDLPLIHPVTAFVLGVLATVSLAIYLLLPSRKRSSKAMKDGPHHIVITGGSSGIGKSLAEACSRLENVAHISILARNLEKLKETQQELLTKGTKCKVHVHSVDITKYKDVQNVLAKLIDQADSMLPTVIFNNAGTSVAKTFLDTTIEEFESLIRLNYMGAVHMTKAFLPLVLKNETKPTTPPTKLVFTSSMAGQIGLYGYTAYSASKFALTGFCHSLEMELQPYRDRISIQMVFPPDTDTPCFAAENLTKPLITKKLSEGGGLYTSEKIAEIMIQHVFGPPKFIVYFGLEGWMLSTLTSGMGPVYDLTNALCQVFLTSLFRLISLFYLWDYGRIIRTDHDADAKEQKQASKTGKSE